MSYKYLFILNFFSIAMPILVSCQVDSNSFKNLYLVSINYSTEEGIEGRQPSTVKYFYTDAKANTLKYVVEDFDGGQSDTIKIFELCIDSDCKQGYYLYKRFFSNNFIDPLRKLPSMARNMDEKAFIDTVKKEYKKWYFASLSDIEAMNLRLYLTGLKPDK